MYYSISCLYGCASWAERAELDAKDGDVDDQMDVWCSPERKTAYH